MARVFVWHASQYGRLAGTNHTLCPFAPRAPDLLLLFIYVCIKVHGGYAIVDYNNFRTFGTFGVYLRIRAVSMVPLVPTSGYYRSSRLPTSLGKF